tara:strand:+ start:1960 stop:2502 length:543 start_codon:yes stop_codon:yes gene_type:complete
MENKTKKTMAQKNTIYTKLHKAKLEIGKITKGSVNPFFKSKYADINSIIEAVEPTLMKHKLIILQPVIDNNVVTQIIDIETGEKIESFLPLPMVTDPQKIIASITYFRRGTLQSLLTLQAVDDDGNESRQTVKKQQKLSQDRFQTGLDKIDRNELTKSGFLKMLEGFELSEVQKAALKLL